ncbi:MAG: ABC transporter substrate binding protein [Syntrophaceae bacterium]
MKKACLIATLFFICSLPCWGMNYHLEILQVGNLESFDMAVASMKAELAQNGLVEGRNLKINRTIIEASVNASAWEKAKIFLKIGSNASRIAKAKPDLVVTVGTPATKYSKDKIIAAGIPLVFTGVAIPELVGCRSKTQAGPGFTGTTIYLEPLDVLQTLKLAFPRLKTLGIIYSDDENAALYVEDIKRSCARLGIAVYAKQVKQSEKITPVAVDLKAKGIDAFYMPLDSYYTLRDYEPIRELRALAYQKKIPVIGSVIGGPTHSRGAILFIASDFKTVGGLTGKQVVKILKDGIKPEAIAIARQEKLEVFIDRGELKAQGLSLSPQILEIAQPLP